MSIENLPDSLKGIIQKDMLEREFKDGLESKLGYRSVVEKGRFPTKIGETTTMTRRGLKAPTTTPLDPTTNTNFDNGLTPGDWTMEQYILGIDQYGDTMDFNFVTAGVEIADRFVENVKVTGIQAMQSLERLSRNKLFDGYMGANTWVRETLGAPGVTIKVDDVRRFNEISVNGEMIPVSVTNFRPTIVGVGTYNLISVAVDGVNVSTLAASGGQSGELTFSASVSVADGTLGNGVVSDNAAVILRPNAKASTYLLDSADLLTMDLIQAGVTVLRNNNVPTFEGGFYNMYLDANSMAQLYRDEEFQRIYRGGYASVAYRNGTVLELQGVRFIQTTEAIQQTLNTVLVKRPIICGQGLIVEGTYDGQLAAVGQRSKTAVIRTVNDVVSVTRPPLDRLGQIIAQSWYWIGGYTIPTDITATQDIIPTANDSYYKRGVVLEIG